MSDLIGKKVVIHDHRDEDDDPELSRPETFTVRFISGTRDDQGLGSVVLLLEDVNGNLVSYIVPTIDDELNRRGCRVHSGW